MTEQEGSRVEAAVAGVHHEHAEAAHGIEPREHVSATDVRVPHDATDVRVPHDATDVRVPHDATDVMAPHLAHHHPADANVGIVRGRPARGALLAAALTAAVTVAGVVLFALAVGGSH